MATDKKSCHFRFECGIFYQLLKTIPSKLNPKLDLVESTTGTLVKRGGKALYFFSKTTGKLHFCAVFILRCCPKTTVLGKG